MTLTLQQDYDADQDDSNLTRGCVTGCESTETRYRVMMCQGIQYTTLYVDASSAQEAMKVANEHAKVWECPAIAESATIA